GVGEKTENFQSTIQYPLPLKGRIQLHNSALALATLEILQQQGWQISEQAIINGIGNTKWPGRMQWFTWKHNNQNYQLLIDGAHNPASAEVLRNYVDNLNSKNITQNINWVMVMLATKNHADLFQALLKTGDKLYLVPVPDNNSANLDYLRKLAHETCPDLGFCSIYPDVFSALDAAFTSSDNQDNLVVLCGSLYLIGYFLGN
ncbi:bifunctional folylpolyglutamate synthase/dihydrofolate synthase, partial [Sphaerospermopsis aphanizomenoides BCCUSP55]|uniref:glutamate ligase domain-containing protein n=1 Tax=Sphaerospermopsis aphanizomenoides TaxID=459663 RepID=UPI002D7EA5AD